MMMILDPGLILECLLCALPATVGAFQQLAGERPCEVLSPAHNLLAEQAFACFALSNETMIGSRFTRQC